MTPFDVLWSVCGVFLMCVLVRGYLKKGEREEEAEDMKAWAFDAKRRERP